MSHEEYMQLKENAQHGDIFLPFTYYYTIMPTHFSSFPLHWHDEFELIYVEEGAFEINIDLATMLATKGSIVLIKPKQLHSFKQYDNMEASYHSLLFNITMINGSSVDTCSVKYLTPMLNGDYTCPPIISPDMNGYDDMKAIFRKMKETYTLKEPFYEFELKGELFFFFKILFSNITEKTENTPKRRIEPTSNLKCIIDYINDNYSKQITIKELAAIIPLNEHYFMKYFKSNMGLSCIEYITEVRMNNAARLLNNNALTIKVVGEMVGIPHASYFNRVFRQTFGMTPKEYRLANYNNRNKK